MLKPPAHDPATVARGALLVLRDSPIERPAEDRDLLERLATDEDMARAWREIIKRSRCVKAERERVASLAASPDKIDQEAARRAVDAAIGHVAFLTYQAARLGLDAEEFAPKYRRWNIKTYAAIAKAARGLAERLKGTNLDALAIPDELVSWHPLTSSFLAALADEAERLSAQAHDEPPLLPQPQAVAAPRMAFVRAVAPFLRDECGGPMLGTLARIASAALGWQVTDEHVKSDLRATKG